MFYNDIYDDNTIERTISWREYHTMKPYDLSQDFVYGQDMMKRIAGQIKQDRLVKYRHVTGFQAVVVGIPSDLFDYRLMIQVQPPDQAGYLITNITNGIGLFTSMTLNAYDLNLDLKTKDSIMFGQYTRHLYFAYY
jgi:hypothetical protein